MKLLLNFLDKLAPSKAAIMIYQRLSNPRIRKSRSFEEEILAKARRINIDFKSGAIQGYAWGNEFGPLALMVHGWEGQAGNFGALVSILVEKGYQVIAYDGPSHGKSEIRKTNMFQYAEFISERIRAHRPQLIISHSFGTVCTLLGLLANPDFSLEQLMIVTTPFSYKEFIDSVVDQLGMGRRTRKKIFQLIEKDSKLGIDEINMASLCPKIKNIKKTIIIHSEDDRVLPFYDAERSSKCIEGSELIKLTKVGHYKILWAEDLKRIVESSVASA